MPALKPLVLAVKGLLTHHSLNDASKGGLGSYGVIWMCVSLLQHNPGGRPDSYFTHPSDTESLGYLVVDFMNHYGLEFDFTEDYISVDKSSRSRREVIGLTKKPWITYASKVLASLTKVCLHAFWGVPGKAMAHRALLRQVVIAQDPGSSQMGSRRERRNPNRGRHLPVREAGSLAAGKATRLLGYSLMHAIATRATPQYCSFGMGMGINAIMEDTAERTIVALRTINLCNGSPTIALSILAWSAVIRHPVEWILGIAVVKSFLNLIPRPRSRPQTTPKHNLENPKRYQYKSVDKSLVSRYVLNPFWNWFVTLQPHTVAPNTITLSGLCIVILNFLTLLHCDPAYLAEKNGDRAPPHWLYFTWAAGLFLYQAFDAIDGKQARRTGMAGPLGEMFDHGCDALNTTLEAILTCYALNLGRSWWTITSQVATLANFYLTTWEEYHTGCSGLCQLFLGVFSGPVEGILMIVIIYIITGFVGPSFWDTGIWTVLKLEGASFFRDVPNVALNELFMYFAVIGLAFNIVTSYFNVWKAITSTGKSCLWPLLLLLPFAAMVFIEWAWLSASSIVSSSLLVSFMLSVGCQFAHQMCSVVSALDANMPRLFGIDSIIQTSALRTGIVVYLSLLISFVTYARFCTLVRDADGVRQEARDIKDKLPFAVVRERQQQQLNPGSEKGRMKFNFH
ncbi:hypothetical protein FISHEDRAFT_70193 [Fistulina hepatica ATCC 64428]|uniref:Choline/ethanolaminephosphotransferase n=1 Tax=Fistulina hepatica ATCC 64428 TaxID=1128425 RepID=A0A0D7AK42_9AGAR|nr:hypothetical protein FISHEDRAFT_70193 [Fistulina hepatica ATCC 64428]